MSNNTLKKGAQVPNLKHRILKRILLKRCSKFHFSTLIFLLLLMNPLAYSANDIQTNINAYEEAVRQADIKVDEFVDAVNSGDPAKIREHTLKIQEDPAAIKQLNKRPQSVRKPFIESTQRIQTKTQSIARQKIAKELGIPESKVKFKKFTNKQVNPTAGHDWDVTVEIDGKEMPLEDEMVRTSTGAKTSKVKTKGAKTIVEESYYEAATGEKAPSSSNKQASQDYKSRAKEFSAKKHVEITSSKHAEAYEGGQEFIDNPKDYKVKDPEKLSKTIEHKSDLDAKKAAEYKAKGEIGKAQISKGEQARQYTKQYKKIIEPRVKAMGGKIPPKVVEGTRILNKIGQTIPGTKTVFTPQDAEIALRQIGETTESIIKKGSALVESSEKFKPKTTAPATGKKTYVKVAKDAATGVVTGIVIFSTAEDIKQKLIDGDVKGAGKIIADNLTGGAISITQQNVEKYSGYQEMKNKVSYANNKEYEAYVLKAGLQLRENGVSKEEAEQIMDDMRRGDRNSFENKRNALQKAGKNIMVTPPKHIDNIGGDEDIITRSADVFIAIGDGILAMPGKAKKFISEGASDVYEIAGGLTEKGVLTELFNQKVESANNLLDIVKNEYRVYTLNKEIEEQKAQKDKIEQQKEIREKLIAQGLSFEEANAIAKKAAHDGDWAAFRKARLDIQAKKDAEAMAEKAGIYPEDVIEFLHCMCRACGGSLGGFYNPKCKSDIGHGPCQCNGPLTIWKTPIPSENKAEIACFNQITAMNYAKSQAVFNEWHQRILNENAQSVKEELLQVHKLLQDPQTEDEAIQLFINIRPLLHPKDTEALRIMIEPKLAQKAQSEIQKGNLEGAIKHLERKNRVAGLTDDRTYATALAKGWLKSWKGAKKTFFPEIRKYLKERKLTDATNKFRILNEWMQPIGENRESPFPPAFKDPEYLTLIEMMKEKEQERKSDIANAWSKSKVYILEKDPKSAVEVIEEVLKKWEDRETYRIQLESELNNLKLYVQNAQSAHVHGDKLVGEGDFSGGVEYYSKSLGIQKDLTVQRKLDELLKKISSAKELLAESRKKWKSGDLEKAIETIQISKDHDPSNKYIEEVSTQMKRQKKMIDDLLIEADKRIVQKNLDGAMDLLGKAGQINNKYPAYTEMLKKLDRAKNKVEEKKRITAEKSTIREPSIQDKDYILGFAGKWNSTYGVMQLNVQDLRVSGNYTHDNGRIDAVLSEDGKTMKGTWAESPSYKGSSDAGKMYFKLSSDGNKIDGLWSYGDAEPTKNWTATRIVDAKTELPGTGQIEQKKPKGTDTSTISIGTTDPISSRGESNKPNQTTLSGDDKNSGGYWQMVEEKGSIGRECSLKEYSNGYYRDTVSGFGSHIIVTKMIREGDQIYCKLEAEWQRPPAKLYPGSTINLPVTISRLADTGKYSCDMSVKFDMHDMECGYSGAGGYIGEVKLDQKGPKELHKAISWKVKEPSPKVAGEKLTIRACYYAAATLCGKDRGMKYYYSWVVDGSGDKITRELTGAVPTKSVSDAADTEGIENMDKVMTKNVLKEEMDNKQEGKTAVEVEKKTQEEGEGKAALAEKIRKIKEATEARKQGIASPVKITTETSFESDMSAGESKNIVTTKATLSFWNVGNQVSGYGEAVMVYQSVSSFNGSSEEERFIGTFSGGPNGIILFKDDLDFPLKVVNGQRVEATFEGESMIFDIPDPSVFEY